MNLPSDCLISLCVHTPFSARCCRCRFPVLCFADDVAEEEDELIESVRADEARFRAFRCFFVIEAFLAQQKVTRRGIFGLI